MFSEGQQADAGGQYIDEAISRGAFSGPAHVRLIVLIDRQKARYPRDWKHGVWNETVYFLCKNLRPFDVSPSTCERIADAIEAEAARIAAAAGGPQATANESTGNRNVRTTAPKRSNSARRCAGQDDCRANATSPVCGQWLPEL